MPRLSTRFAAIYGSHPPHLLPMLSGFALMGYILVVVKPATLWNSGTWWQSIAVWLAAVVVVHDLVFFPLYALADRALWARRQATRDFPKVLARNYIRVPALGAGLTLLIFLPGTIEQGGPTYLAATGQTQQPFPGRWLLLTVAVLGLSAVCYPIRLVAARGAPRPAKAKT